MNSFFVPGRKKLIKQFCTKREQRKKDFRLGGAMVAFTICDSIRDQFCIARQVSHGHENEKHFGSMRFLPQTSGHQLNSVMINSDDYLI